MEKWPPESEELLRVEQQQKYGDKEGHMKQDRENELKYSRPCMGKAAVGRHGVMVAAVRLSNLGDPKLLQTTNNFPLGSIWAEAAHLGFLS